MGTRRRKLGIRLAGLGLALLSGCASTVEKCTFDPCPDFPPGAMPPKTGTHVRQIMDMQSMKAEADDFVIYKNEWFMGGVDLGPYGKYHLQQIAQRLPSVPFPVVIQTTTDPRLNELRRLEVVKALSLAGLGDVEQRVVVGFPEGEGLYGDEAERIYGQMIQGGGNPYGGGFGTGYGGYGGGNFFGGSRSQYRSGLGLGNYPFFR